MIEGKAKFLAWVKIRIGEPLTAVEVDECTSTFIQKRSYSEPSQGMWAHTVLTPKKRLTSNISTNSWSEE